MKKLICPPVSKATGPEQFKLSEHVDDLVDYLEHVQSKLSSGGDRLRGWRDTLTAVTRFVEATPGLESRSTLTNPLRELAVALTDILRGTPPDQLFISKLPPGRPLENLTSLRTKAVSAAGFYWLKLAGFKSLEAANFVANELKQSGVKVRGVAKSPTKITAKQVVRWWYSLNGALRKRLDKTQLKLNTPTKKMAEIERLYFDICMSLVAERRYLLKRRKPGGTKYTYPSPAEAQRTVQHLLRTLVGPPS